MQRSEFKEFVDKLYMYFRNKEYADKGQVEMWYEEVKFIPSDKDVRQWIFNRMKKLKSLPFNIPMEITKQWRAYQVTHPKKTIAEKYGDCADCKNHGTHMFKKTENLGNYKMKIDYVALCKLCDNWRKHFGRYVYHGGVADDTGKVYQPTLKTTKAEIIANGWEYVEQYDPPGTGQQLNPAIASQTVKELAKRVGKRIPPLPTEQDKILEAQRQRRKLQKDFDF